MGRFRKVSFCTKAAKPALVASWGGFSRSVSFAKNEIGAGLRARLRGVQVGLKADEHGSDVIHTAD